MCRLYYGVSILNLMLSKFYKFLLIFSFLNTTKIAAKMGNNQKSFIMIKPDGVRKGLIGKIISKFEKRGFKMTAGQLIMPQKHIVEQHYAEHTGKPFFNDLVNFIAEGPVFISVWEGTNVISIARTMLGATNPANAAPGTIRGDYAIETSENICHASDCVESAEREISLWFGTHISNIEL